MMYTLLSSSILILCMNILSVEAQHHHSSHHLSGQIEFAMDKRNGLNPNSHLRVTNELFDIHLIDNEENLRTDMDMYAHADWFHLMEIINNSTKNIPAFIRNNANIISMFDNKVEWKDWMKRIGLGDAVPKAYNISNDHKTFDFPLILKTNQHFGRGVHIIQNITELSSITKQFNKDKVEFMLEESLTGLGMQELSAYGSAYDGKIVSIRCMLRSYKESAAAHSGYRKDIHTSNNNTNTSSSTTTTSSSTAQPFVRGFQLKPAYEYFIPCGQDLIKIHQIMFKATNYTGSWCSQIKLDQKMQPKILEINARFCGSLAGNDALFVTSFLPLAYAIKNANPSAHINHTLSGPLNHTFLRIYTQEKRALETGGGFFQRHWITVDKFNPLLQLDPVDQYLTRRAIRAYSKIVVSVKDPDLLLRLSKLKATSTLFEFRSSSSTSSSGSNNIQATSTVQENVDFTLPEPVAITQASDTSGNSSLSLQLWKKALARLGYGAYVSTETAHVSADKAGSSVGTVRVFGSVYQSTLLSMRCVQYTSTATPTTATGTTAAPTKQLVACGRDLVSVLTGYFAQSAYFTGAFCATIETDSSDQPKFTELQTGLCEELTVSDAGFIGAYVPLAAALFNAKYTSSSSKEVAPLELNWLHNRNIYSHLLKVEKEVVVGGGGSQQGKLITVDKFNPAQVVVLDQTGYLPIDKFPIPQY